MKKDYLKNYALITLSCFVGSTLFSFIRYMVYGDNFIEALIMCSYSISICMLIGLLVVGTEKSEIISKIWMIPAVIYLVAQLLNIIRYISYVSWDDMLLDAITIASFGFAGLWIKSIVGGRKKSDDEIGEKSGDSINKLEVYKKLLDSGIITQEEFDAKKKQLLKL